MSNETVSNEIMSNDTTTAALEKLCFVVEITAGVLGTGGNFLVFMAVLTTAKLRTPGNMLILNLTVADLLVTAVSQPINSIGQIRHQKFFEVHPDLCAFIAAICTIACVVSFSTIGCISINRCIYICYNELYKSLFTPVTIVLLIICLWVFSTLIYVPLVTGWGRHGYDPKFNYCLWDRHYQPNYPLLIGGVIAMWIAITFICYGYIYLWVKKQRQALTAKKVDIGLAKTLFIIFMVYITCWLPLAGLLIIDHNDNAPTAAYLLTLMLAHANSSFNGFIYGFRNQTFRQAYKMVLARLLCQKITEPPRTDYSTRTKRNQTQPATTMNTTNNPEEA